MAKPSVFCKLSRASGICCSRINLTSLRRTKEELKGMIAAIYFFTFLIMGLVIAHKLFSSHHPMIRLWAGILFGTLGMIWCFIPIALNFGFNYSAHIMAFLLMGAVATFFSRFGPSRPVSPEETFSSSFYQAFLLISGIILILFYRQILYPFNSAYFAGPATYGDLPFHLNLITNTVAGGAIPSDNPIFPGTSLAYPFFFDVLSASLYLLGLNLRWAVLLPSLFLTVAVVGGFIILAKEVLKKEQPAALAAFLFFFSGGFGFVYFMDNLKTDPHNFLRLVDGFYFSPTNWYEKNLYLLNSINHMMIPQRTTLVGWAFLFFILWLLQLGIRKLKVKYFLTAGIVQGLLLMVHSSSFLNASFIALTWMIVYFFTTREKGKYVLLWLVFLVPAICLALPQYSHWLNPYEARGSFLKFYLGWSNESDWWVWFWIKNAGVVFLLALPAFFSVNKWQRCFYCGAVTLFIFAETVLLTPNKFDNNKILHVWYAMTAIIVAAFLINLFQRMSGLKGRTLFVGTLIVFAIFSGILTTAHDMCTAYELFPWQKIEVANFIERKTLTDGLFVSSQVHNHPVTSLAGRKTLCGYQGWLHSHGIKYQSRYNGIVQFYADPERHKDLLAKYHVDYIYLSDDEIREFHIPPHVDFDRLFVRVFTRNDVKIYAVSNRALKLAEY